MSVNLYNMVCGRNPAVHGLMRVIGLSPVVVPRFRDISINTEMTEVTVFARIGGTYRETYKDEITLLTQHPFYLRDYDSILDSTYANFIFSVPETGKIWITKSIEDMTQGDENDKEKIYAAITEAPDSKFAKALAAVSDLKNVMRNPEDH